ncbi:DUF1508 domain-containing protein [Rhizobium sp. BG4]|uniref:DUF1508 domain-containing protein n=1 Tax=Rhizobium sp. BG4 TaxID=2613770 RepID=UPI00193E842C|nr:DUF1508 domain-containing protein [Rhizobium sp. BG4]
MSKFENKPLPEFETDEEAERFVDEADLSQFDLRTNRRMVRFDFVEQDSARFQIFLDQDGKFRFRLRDGTGNILLVSEAYQSKEAAIQVIEAFKSGVVDTETDKSTPPKVASRK